MSDRSTGMVKWFDPSKGHGFITSDDHRDFFMHSSQLVDPEWVPDKRERVTFVEDRGRDGRVFARRVQILEDGK